MITNACRHFIARAKAGHGLTFTHYTDDAGRVVRYTVDGRTVSATTWNYLHDFMAARPHNWSTFFTICGRKYWRHSSTAQLTREYVERMYPAC